MSSFMFKYELTPLLAHMQTSQNTRKLAQKQKQACALTFGGVHGITHHCRFLKVTRFWKKSPSGGTYDTGVQNIR